jgi:hypothetical protein
MESTQETNDMSFNTMFPRDMVCLRNISVDTLHKGGTDDEDYYYYYYYYYCHHNHHHYRFNYDNPVSYEKRGQRYKY